MNAVSDTRQSVGALLTLRICELELSFIAMIGILLLVGVVKKNAIMMIDFALAALPIAARHGRRRR